MDLRAKTQMGESQTNMLETIFTLLGTRQAPGQENGVAIAGNKFWIPSDVAEALQNKTLTISRREGELESLLVAV